MFYSKTKNAFYDGSLKNIYESSGTWPDDVIEISKETYEQLIYGQSNGKKITSDQKGNPILVDLPPPTDEDLINNALLEVGNLLNMASQKIAPLQDAVDIDEATNEEITKLREWKKYRVMLNRVESQSGFPKNIDWPLKPD